MPTDDHPTADALPPLREVISTHGLLAKKTLGQHFLLDLNLTRRIVRAAGPRALRGATVIEVGPGPGGLTRALLESEARRVVAVERDDRCLAALAALRDVYGDRFALVAGDALKVDEEALLGGEKGWIIANLPYNISTQLVVKWAARPHLFHGLVLMFQKEVADRLLAAPGSKSYGRLGVLAQWRFAAERCFDIGPKAFVPPPKVTSTVVKLTPHTEPIAAADAKTLSQVTAAAFGKRRKMLRSSLKALNVDVERVLAEAGIAPTARAEEIDVPGFCALARAVDEARREAS